MQEGMQMNFNIPEKMLAWPLFGAGMEKFGLADKPCEVPVPKNKEDEILVRIDAVGLCFSDVKLIKAGEKHPRVISGDLSKNPVIPGHEAVMTVVKVGSKYASKFRPGQRFIIQADIYYKGRGLAYGYAIDGGFAQYSIIDERVIEGDECCYLLPLADSIPSAIAAMIEPWTCVIASYMIEKRHAPLKGGKMLIAGAPDDSIIYVPGKLLEENPPSKISVMGLPDSCLSKIQKAFPGIKLERLDAPLQPIADGFDDIFICNLKDRALAEKLSASATKDAFISFLGNYDSEKWGFDVGAIHYKGWFYQGSPTENLSDSYGRNARSSVLKNGTCWLVGGAGAMGQMHTQLAVESTSHPARILVSDMDEARIQNLKDSLREKIEANQIDFKTLNPKNFPSVQAFLDEVAKFADDGFDDIVMLVPSVPVLNSSVPFLKENGLMNIFAGIPSGSEGLLEVGAIAARGARFIGASGSKTSDLQYTLSLVESGKLDPSASLAAVGGMKQLKEGLKAVESAKFPGKTVIFPNILDMPLTKVADLPILDSKFSTTLSEKGAYSMKTENLIMKGQE